MMGDPGTSGSKLLYPSLGIEEWDVLHVPARGSALEPSELVYSNSLHGQNPLFLSSTHQHLGFSFRSGGSEAWSNRDFEGVSVGPRNCAQDLIQSRSSHSADTLELMGRARVGEDDLVTFPEGEADAVTITARDLASLQPGKFLTDNVVDFYIKYLKEKPVFSEHQSRLHFFNSFFFRRVIKATASTGDDECRVDYSQLRKWIGDVNLFDKDFVFVPVIASSHWSLLVICHLPSLNPNSVGERKGSPCILHLDPIEGKHGPFEDRVKSLIVHAWVETFGVSNHFDILHSLVQMKYVQAKVSQQGNGYDCGLYILHYIEVFLTKLALQELIVSSSEGGVHFTRPSFIVEVSIKRNVIRHQLCRNLQVDDLKHMSLEPILEEVRLVHSQSQQHQDSPKVVKELKSKKWKEMETSILLECVDAGGVFSKGNLGTMHWDLIAEEINSKKNGGPLRTKEQCQNRFDTLLKAYKDLNAYCVKVGKDFSNVSEDEKRSLKLATPLRREYEQWYKHLHTIYKLRSSLKDQSHKRRKTNGDGDMDVNKPTASLIYQSQQCTPLEGIGSSISMEPSSGEVVVRKFNEMEEALKYTFFNLIQVLSLKTRWVIQHGVVCLEDVCRRLAIVEDRNPFGIRNHVYELQNLKLVTLKHMDINENCFEGCWMDNKWLEISDFELYKKFGRKLLSKNLHLNIFRVLSHIDGSPINLFPLQQIRVLNLHGCCKIETLDLENFPHMCCLDIVRCMNLKVVNGWEVPKWLGWIEIYQCNSYCDVPDVQFLSSLKEFYFSNSDGQRIPWQLANFSPCIQLRRLQIENDDSLVDSMDLKALRSLEVLSFACCDALSTIHGLSGLQTLMTLDVYECRNLEWIPNLGCLKVLTYLDMSCSGITEILGVEELHLLTWLDVSWCCSLKSLPPLGHLKALSHLDLSGTGAEEICGVENLVSLEILLCQNSKLQQLPNLEHLRRLRKITVDGTPLFRMDPSRSFIGGYELIHNGIKKEGVFLVDVDDISFTNADEDILCDED